MRRTAAVALVWSVSALVPAAAWAGPPTGIASAGSGVRFAQGPNSADPTCGSVGNECRGDLLTCSPGQAIAVGRMVLRFIEDVCDDSDAAPNAHCGGKFTALAEACQTAFSWSPSGDFLSVDQVGVSRVCYDSSGLGDCTGTLPAGSVIATYHTRNSGYGSVSLSRGAGVSELALVKGSNPRFSFNGSERRIKGPKVGSAIQDGEIYSPSLPCGNRVTPPVGFGCGFAFTVLGRVQ